MDEVQHGDEHEKTGKAHVGECLVQFISHWAFMIEFREDFVGLRCYAS